ncbi:MAG: tetraacyldisaccharide 4'-kinase [candidate division Zixibacteria bacterium]|nr:tetraacyldisaccharide 4'-kinase [candidate division Zixibacteria bacterium]
MLRRLRQKIIAVQAGRDTSRFALVLRTILLPFSFLYAIAVGIRNLAYAFKILKPKPLPGKVISIGNITTGGTGKTPVTLLLAEKLTALDRKFAILTRGYGATYSHSDIVFNSGKVDRDTIDWLADEVVMLTDKLDNCWFGIGWNRHGNGMVLYDRHGIDLFLLDDGFQHRCLARDLDLVLLDATTPFGNGHRLPGGNLRESKRALKRADMVLLTRTELLSDDQIDQLLDMVCTYVLRDSVFMVFTKLAGLRDLATGENVAVDSLREKRIYLLSGVGNPDSFASLLAKVGTEVVGHTIFADHHHYTSTDINMVVESATHKGAEVVITTEKDAVKLLPSSFAPNTCLVAEIEVAIAAREDIFFQRILEVIGC